ncbi:MAG TPA: hypothetical protein VID47_19145 [Actinomycetota bacterium]
MQEDVRKLSRGMRAVGVIGAVLVLFAGTQLFVLSDHTERLFAWTLPGLSAAFIGSFYWAGLVLIVAVWRHGTWAAARPGMLAVIAFTALTLVATLLHLGLFHLHAPHTETVVATWAWIVVYAVVPVLLFVVWRLQLRGSGVDPPRTEPLPRWLRAVLLPEGVLLLAVALALFVAPGWADGWWPWPMTPLAGRVIGAWLVAIGGLLLGIARENDWDRVRPSFVSYFSLGVLWAISVARYANDVKWGSFSAWVLVAAIALAIGLGGYGIWAWNPRSAAEGRPSVAAA